MLRLTSVGWKFATVGASAALHLAALATVTAGHATARATPADGPALEVAIDTADPEVVTPLEASRAQSTAARWPTHTHRYPVPASHDDTPHDPALVHVSGATNSMPAAPPPPEPAPVVAADEAMPRFTIVVGPGSTEAGHTPAGASHSAATAAGDGDAEPLPEEAVSSPARAVQRVLPVYPSEARSQGVEADVPLEIVVSTSGTVESARPLQHAGLGLEQAALVAIRRFLFAPAIHDGHAVRVRMRWTMQFRLQ